MWFTFFDSYFSFFLIYCSFLHCLYIALNVFSLLISTTYKTLAKQPCLKFSTKLENKVKKTIGRTRCENSSLSLAHAERVWECELRSGEMVFVRILGDSFAIYAQRDDVLIELILGMRSELRIYVLNRCAHSKGVCASGGSRTRNRMWCSPSLKIVRCDWKMALMFRPFQCL